MGNINGSVRERTRNIERLVKGLDEASLSFLGVPGAIPLFAIVLSKLPCHREIAVIPCT